MHLIDMVFHIASNAHATVDYTVLHIARWADPVMVIARSGTAQVCEHVDTALKYFAARH